MILAQPFSQRLSWSNRLIDGDIIVSGTVGGTVSEGVGGVSLGI